MYSFFTNLFLFGPAPVYKILSKMLNFENLNLQAKLEKLCLAQGTLGF
jgi:hypothetical protein